MPTLVTLREKGSGNQAAPGLGAVLSLAAAPIFAAMAVLSGLQDEGAVLCSTQHASPLTGMTAMYVLMSAFHLPPWLKVIARWWHGGRARRANTPIAIC